MASSAASIAPGDVHRHPAAREWSCAVPPADALEFHRGLDGYAATPLRDLPDVARSWGVGRVLLKDESDRFGLPAFKALGVSYAMYRLVCERVGRPIRPAGWDDLCAAVRGLPPFEFVTATDGNHGRAVARFAARLGVSAHVIVPDVVSTEAIDAIRGEGARVSVVAEDYDGAVLRAAREAERPGVELLQDNAWPGYEVVPQWIVDGYSTLSAEVDAQAAAMGAGAPDVVVVPMGVGSFAQSVVAHYRGHGAPRAALIGVEPASAACVQASRVAGELVSVATGTSIMTGMNCGTVSSLAWPYLRDGLDAAVAVSEEQAADAVERLTGLGISSGPCGAATLAAVETILDDDAASLGLSPDATVVLLSTEARPATPRSNGTLR